ncbi:tetratricopeptide repeat protein [Streptomyces litchfieldiae]|uniref:Tetratricopeptide repeat protein n=1 Tax=Streptomyces litchfieldiae TaxID=3075543 RepID=A0ABU2MN41_9ACTN|nr:tetratricopeptide repeat protein [Streptomyces sp. DSM 44938]MDT0342353.1 tetratricopeptide repeat protein [Streptomyces sp. DSM 44938]
MRAQTGMNERHRAEVDRLLARAVDEEVRRSEGRIDGEQLLMRARGELAEIVRPAEEEYAAYAQAEADSAPGRLGDRFAPRALAGLAGAAGAAALATLLLVGSIDESTATAFTDAVIVAAAALLGFTVQAVVAHLWSAERTAGRRHQPGGVEQLRLAWRSAVEVRGIRPYLEQRRVVAPRRDPLRDGESRRPQTRPPARARDRSGVARTRSVLARSFDRLPDPGHPFIGRRSQLTQITQWVNRDRARTDTRPTVVVLHGPSGSGRTMLARWAAHELRELFRGACLVDLRGQSEIPLGTRDALLHLMNRLGAPREQLLFREGIGQGADAGQLRRLAERYHQHLAELPVVIILDDATDAEQVATLIPARSSSLVLVTAAEPMALDPELPASVHHMELGALDQAAAEELLRASVTDGATIAPGPYDEVAWRRVTELCDGRPLLLRMVGSALDERSPAQLADDLAAYGPPGGGLDPAERAMRMRYADQPEMARRLLRRLALAGRASLGARAAAALLDVGQQEAARQLEELTRAGLLRHVRGSRYRLHDLVRRFARARLHDEESDEERSAAQERLIRSYAELADTVIRLVDGKTSTRADLLPAAAGGHGFTSLDAALRWLDDETSFITSTLRHADERVDRQAVQHLLGALCDYCLLRGDLYRLGELNELTQAVNQGLLTRSVQWRTGVAARQLGELDKARSTLTSVVSLYQSADNGPGTARALRDLGITLQHQGQLREAGDKLREALDLQQGAALDGDRAWTLHALAAVERECGRIGAARGMLGEALRLHQGSGSVHGEAWTRFQLGQTLLCAGDVPAAERELRLALDLYERSRDVRGVAWAMTELGLARVHAGDPAAAQEELTTALARHRETEDARGEAWTLYDLGQALEESGDTAGAVRTMERARTMFSRMRDVFGLASARHHSARLTRDMRAESTGSLRNSGFARQLLTDARRDYQRAGVRRGEAWSCVELAVIEAGNERLGQALELADEALRLFTEGYGEGPDARGADWAQLLRCTLLPLASPGGSEVGQAVAQEELAQLLRSEHPLRDPRVTDVAHTYALVLERGQGPEDGWPAWRLGMVPRRGARDVIGVAAPTP